MNCPKMYFYAFNILILSQGQKCNFMIYGEDEIAMHIFATFKFL
jgi:hypothetical protein